MIHIKDHKTLNLFKPFPFLGPKRRRLIEASWAKLFRDQILFELPVEKIFKNYQWAMGRPTKELYTMLGVMILQQMHDLTDEETIQQYAFNIAWHYALDLTDDSDATSYLCAKTLWTMRHLLTQQDLYGVLFESVTDKLAKVFSVDSSKQRYDSVHLFSNMRHLGRIGLFVATIRRFLVNLKRHERALFDTLGPEWTNRYMTKQGQAVFSMVKPTESVRTLEGLGKDLFFLVEQFKANPHVTGMTSYHLLLRLLREQCRIEGNTETIGGCTVSVKLNKEVHSDSLQNPSDPDASYDGHKGQGYQMQVAETYSREETDPSLRLITEVFVEPAHRSDAEALIPLIEATKQRGMGPEQVLADSLYGGDDNCEQARERHVEVISPVIGRPHETELTLANFTLGADGITVEGCPQGHAPVQIKPKKKKHTAVFSPQRCGLCPQVKSCPVKPGGKGYYLHYDEKALRLAQRRAYEKTPAFREIYRFRAGIEGTMSQLDRITGVKHLRVRGLAAVSFCATLKAAGINLLRATAFRNSQDSEKRASEQRNPGLFGLFSIFKERIIALWAHFKTYRPYFNLDQLIAPKMAV